MRSNFAAYFFPLLFMAVSASAQPPGFHKHDGFYLSMCVGPGYGPIELDASGDSTFSSVTTTGPGGVADIKVGYAVVENVILSFDIIVRAISGPEMESDGFTVSSSDNVTAADQSFGLGITYYFMPMNIFVSGTLGSGQFTLENKTFNFRAESEYGTSFHVKVGKEWWTGKNWGLGVAAGFGRVVAEDQPNSLVPAYKGELSTGKFFVLFNTTFN